MTNTTVFNNLLSRLIVLEDVQFADVDLGSTYALAGGGSGRNRTLEDCFDNLVIVRNSDFADFAGTEIPAGNGQLTAVLSVFGSTVQLTLRNTEDVKFTGERCNGGGNTGGEEVSIQSACCICCRYDGSGLTTQNQGYRHQRPREWQYQWKKHRSTRRHSRDCSALCSQP
ncbi:MAG: DUF5689 domain-containing protein [Saprospiraceae bacterium]